MNTKKCILVSALPLAVGLTMFASSQPPTVSENTARALARLAETSAALQKASAEKARVLKAAFDARLRAAATVPPPICEKWLTVKEVSTDVTPHFRLRDVVSFVGPMAFSGAYQVAPVDINGGDWDPPWKQGYYLAIPNPLLPDFYDLHGVWVNQHNGGDPREHEYTLQVTERDSNNCPEFVIVEGECHAGGPCPEDPGHANLD